MDNNEIFLQFWENYNWPEPSPVVFRLYHTEDGDPLEYSHEIKDGLYIELDPDTFNKRNMNVRIKNSKLIVKSQTYLRKLVPSDSGTACHPLDISIIRNQTDSHQYWQMKEEFDEN